MRQNPPGSRPPIAALALLELLIWAVPVSLFLLAYHAWLPIDAAVSTIHLALLLPFYASLYVFRMLLCRFGGALGPHLAAGVFVLSVAALLLFYLVVLIGIRAWNQVPSFELLSDYVNDLPGLFRTLGLGGVASVAIVFIALGSVLGFYSLGLVSSRLSLWLSRKLSAITLSIVSGALLGICALTVYEVRVGGDWANRMEPVSFAFMAPETAFQHHGLNPSRLLFLDREHEAARDRYQPTEDFRNSNVILIVVDAQRGDHIPENGYSRDTMPRLSGWLDKASAYRSFSRGQAICAESRCGITALIASLYLHRMASSPLSLSEVLGRHDYVAHYFLSGGHANFYGLEAVYGEGNFHSDSLDTGRSLNDDRMILDALESFSPERRKGNYLHFHLMSTHILGKRFLEPHFIPQKNYGLHFFRGGSDSESVRLESINYYDNGVIQTDWMIDQILHRLSAEGLLESALVIIASDHGEELGEHGRYQHANNVWRPSLSIPMIFLAFGGDDEPLPWSEGEYASQADLAPTVLDYLGMPVPDIWQGESLLSPRGRDFSYFRQGTHFGLVYLGREREIWKYWIDRESGEEFLYELMEDPGERQSRLSRVDGELLEKLREEHRTVFD